MDPTPPYEPRGLRAAHDDFARRFPTFDPDGTFDELRRTEYGRLDDQDQVYLDYTGGGLYADSQLTAHLDLLRTRVLGNPHSNNPTSLAMTLSSAAYSSPIASQNVPSGRSARCTAPIHFRDQSRYAACSRRSSYTSYS